MDDSEQIMRKELFTAWLCLLLVSSALFIFSYKDNIVTGQEGMKAPGSYTICEPFRINCNFDFTSTAWVTDGDGSAENPWVIENLKIDGTGKGYCIFIGNTTDYFIVRNCFLHNASGAAQTNEWYYSNAGLVTISDHGLFENNIFMNNSYGMRVSSSDRFSIINNSATKNHLGIYVLYSTNGVISQNNAFNNTVYGLSMYVNNNFDVDRNNISYNGYSTFYGAGFPISSSSNIRVTNNSFISNFGPGIQIAYNSNNITVSHNDIKANNLGLEMDSFVSGSHPVDISIFHNNFMSNLIQAADDQDYYWDNGYPTGGNYWSDYSGSDAKNGPDQNIPGADGIGDMAYTNINGTSISRDRYPFMDSLDLDFPIADAGPNQLADSGTLIYFSATGSTDNRGIANYTWYFSHNGTEMSLFGPMPSFRFWESGNHTVELVVADLAGNLDSDMIVVSITDAVAPLANAGSDKHIKIGLLTRFNGSGSTDDLGIVNYTWTFNDGIGSQHLFGISPSHRFSVLGTFSITLNTTDLAGNWDTDSLEVIVLETVIVANAGPDISCTQGASVTLDGSNTTGVVSDMTYTWTYSTNSRTVVFNGISPTAKFWVVGTYTVTLTVTDSEGNWATDTMIVEVAEPEIEEVWPGYYLLFIAIPLAALACIFLTFRILWK